MYKGLIVLFFLLKCLNQARKVSGRVFACSACDFHYIVIDLNRVSGYAKVRKLGIMITFCIVFYFLFFIFIARMKTMKYSHVCNELNESNIFFNCFLLM
jgi:hypothetical protein